MSEPSKAAMRAATAMPDALGIEVLCPPIEYRVLMEHAATIIDSQFADVVSALEWLTHDHDPDDKVFDEWFEECRKNARKVLKQIR